MKLIQISDLHIDSKMETNFTSSMAKERNNEILVTLEKLFTIMQNENYQAMLIVGDMFDTKKMTSKSFNYVMDLISKNNNKQFFYVAGNHDSETDLILNSQNIPNNLKIFDTSFQTFKLSEKINISGIQLTSSNASNIGTKISLNSDEINIMMLHASLTKQSNRVDNENVYISELKNKNIDYLALGHIHSYSSGKIDDRCTYAYSGCLEPRGFDEFGDKGYISIEIDELNNKVSHKFIKFSSRTFISINVDISELETTRQILEKIYENTVNISTNNLLKITLIGTYSENTIKGLDLIQTELSSKFYYVKLVDNTKLKISLDDYNGNFSLKGIFIKKVLESKKIPEELKDEVIMTGIKALEQEDID